MLTNEILNSLWPVIFLNCILISTLIIFLFIYRQRPKDAMIPSYKHATFIGPFLREWGYWVTSWLIYFFIKIKITPNILTIISPIVALITGYFYYKGDFAEAGWILIAGGIFDMLDGRLARITNQITKEGAYLDSNLDRYSDGIIFAGIALYFRDNLFMLIITILSIIGTEVTSYSKARGEIYGIVSKIGLMQRVERIVLLWIVSIFHPFIMIILNKCGITREYPIIIAIILMAVLTNYTAIHRIVYIFREIRKQSR